MIARSDLSALWLSLLVCLTLFNCSASGSSFISSGASESAPLGSCAQSSCEAAMEKIGPTTYIEQTSDAPDETPAPSKWNSPIFYSDLSAFNVTHFSSGRKNLEIVAGVTPDAENTALADDPSTWSNASSMLQVFYPEGSINPKQRPQGGSQFYAAPLDVRHARSVTFAYSIFFPSDFDWVKGGKLPGLYGGRTGCSGGDAADDCFSTRMMWRRGGAGELYLVRPQPVFSCAVLVILTLSRLVRAEGPADAFPVQYTAAVGMRAGLRALHRSRIVSVCIGIVDAPPPNGGA